MDRRSQHRRSPEWRAALCPAEMAIWQEIHPPSSNPLRLQDGTAPPRYQRRETLLLLQPKSLRSSRQSQPPPRPIDRSEEHTSESVTHAHHVCRLLLEKKKRDHFRTPLHNTHPYSRLR